jgi:hypothetical protein
MLHRRLKIDKQDYRKESSEKKIANFTYYSAAEAWFMSRRFPIEIVHAVSMYENQIETFSRV